MGFQDRPPTARDHGDARDGRRRRRPLRALARVVGVLALVGVLVVAGYVLWIQRTVAGNIEHEDLRGDDSAVITISASDTGGRQPSQDDAGRTDDGGAGEDDDGDDDSAAGGGADAEDEEPLPPIVDDDGEAVDLSDGAEMTATSPSRPAQAGDALNFLIIGTDTRDLSVERGRSDVIVLMHISDERDRVDLVHFPRDLFVPIPGTGGSSKINAAYAYGGAPLLIQTLQPLVDVPIDHVVMLDFESFKAITDAIGGVDVTVTEAGGGFSPGVHHMDGEEGLLFVRERYSLSQGDISRGERQMQFVKAVMLKTLSRETLTNPARLANVVDAATTNLTVDDDLRVGDMRNLAFAMRDVRGDDIHFWQGPWCGIEDHPVAGSIIRMSQSQMDTLSEHLRTDTMEDYVDDVSPQQGFSGVCG